MLKTLRSSSSTCEQQAKFIQERITSVEKHFSELCLVFSAYARKAARLRDRNDEIAKAIEGYAKSEDINRSLSEGLLNFSLTILSLGDYRDAYIQKIDVKVVGELSQYESICKHAKEEVKNTFNAKEKELSRKRQLDRLRERNPQNRHQISQAESELVKATAEVSRTIRSLEDQTNEFEKRKLKDIKSILLDFITIEIGFHSKALEILTKAYQSVNTVDDESDLEEFQSKLRVSDISSRPAQRLSFNNKRSQSLGSLEAHSTYRTPKAAPRSKTPVSKSIESMDSMKMSIGESTNTIDDETDEESVTLPPSRRLFT